MNKRKTIITPPTTEKPTRNFEIKYPLLWLVLAAIIVYAGSLSFGFTELDDSIFIRDLYTYNEDLSNLVHSFQRGVFDPTKDNYYRPLFLDSIILNYQLSEQNIAGYHLVNLLLHVLSIVLVYKLFLKIGLNALHSFLLSLLFAVHPVISQAVVWIPGRNDTMMTVFVLPFLIYSIDYAQKGKINAALLSFLFLVLGFFTKETALLAPVAAFIILTLIIGKSIREKNMLIQYGFWIGALIIYLGIRSTATLKDSSLDPVQMLNDFFNRLPVLIQYIGKIFLPFNLSVFPVQVDTVYYFGIAATILLIALIVLSKEKNKKIIIAGFLFFFIFLLPVLFVPNTLNEQTFEHRLYLPFIGILLVLSQTIIFKNNLSGKQLVTGVSIAAIILSVINYRHQQNFKDPLTFWQSAAETSPHSAYAVMMYGARVEDKQEGYRLMRRAYQLNPNEKYLNYYYGVMLQNQDSVLAAEKHFLKEQEISDYYEVDFYLAHVYHYKKEPEKAEQHLRRYLTRDSMQTAANNNLLLLYIETKQKDKALVHIKVMQRRGLIVPPALIQQVQAIPQTEKEAQK